MVKKLSYILFVMIVTFYILDLTVVLGNQLVIVPPSKSKGEIKGQVLDKSTKQPLPGVNIIIEGTQRGTTSDSDGKFSITKLAVGNYNLIFSFMGYAKKRIENIVIEEGISIDLDVVELEEQPILLKEIVVTPGRFAIMGNEPVARQTLTDEEIKNISFGEDLTRAIVRLPGISSNDFSAKFTVRGGESNEILVLMDGVQLYEPFHQKDYLGGLLSIIDIDVIDGIDLLTGGFSAEYGERMSGVFNIKSKKTPEIKRRTSLGISLMNARLFSEGTFAKNKGSWLVSARRGYLDIVLGIMGSDDEFKPIYYDTFGKVAYNLNSKHRLSASVLHAKDWLKFRDISYLDEDVTNTSYGDTYGWLNLQSFYNPKLYCQTVLYAGIVNHNRRFSFKSGYENHFTIYAVRDVRDFRFFGIKQDWNFELFNNLYLKWGFDVKKVNVEYDYYNNIQREQVTSEDSLIHIDRVTDIKTDRSGEQAGLYVSTRFKIIPPFALETGLRYDYASYSNDKLLSPRVNFAYSLGRHTFIRGGWGYFYQPQGINELQVQHGIQEYYSAKLAKHYVLGFEHFFNNGFNFRIEGYYKELSSLYHLYQNLENEIDFFPETREDIVKLSFDGAVAKGIEFYLKYDLGKKISFWGSYALAYAEDDIQKIT
ncbi:MAG: TonB-dependent receptor, partial [bacterium]